MNDTEFYDWRIQVQIPGLSREENRSIRPNEMSTLILPSPVSCSSFSIICSSSIIDHHPKVASHSDPNPNQPAFQVHLFSRSSFAFFTFTLPFTSAGRLSMYQHDHFRLHCCHHHRAIFFRLPIHIFDNSGTKETVRILSLIFTRRSTTSDKELERVLIHPFYLTVSGVDILGTEGVCTVRVEAIMVGPETGERAWVWAGA